MPALNYAPNHEGLRGRKISAPSILTWTGITINT